MPLVCWAPLRAVPSPLSADTIVVSMASCAPLNKGRPSATTSNLLLSKECPRQKIQVPHHGVESHTSTCFSTDLSSRSLQRVAPSPKNPCNSTRRAMMATSIEWTATSALTCGEGEGKVQASKEEHTEGLRVKPRETVG